MFNTLGNIQSNSQTALLFLNFETREGVALNGEIQKFTPSVGGQIAASETVFNVKSAKYLPRALAHSWKLLEYSPFN